MGAARFTIVARFDGIAPTVGTVTIDRNRMMFQARAKRRRRVYELHLSDVATMVCQRILKAEWAEEARRRRRHASYR